MDHNTRNAQAINDAAYDAIKEARGYGMDLGQTSATVAEAVAVQIWSHFADLYGGHDPDIQHGLGAAGGCSLCILRDIAVGLGRPHLMDELEQAKAALLAEEGTK